MINLCRNTNIFILIFSSRRFILLTNNNLQLQYYADSMKTREENLQASSTSQTTCDEDGKCF